MAIELSEVPSIAITLMLSGVILVALFLAMSGLRESEYGFAGCNSTNKTGCSNAYWAISNVSEGATNVVEFIPTVGTLLGVALLVGVVYLGFMYMRGRNNGV